MTIAAFNASVFLVLLFAACVSGDARVIYQPEAVPEHEFEHAEIIESQNGADGTVPEWVSRFLRGGTGDVEGMEQYRDKYVFIGENRGSNFSALEQWARYFSAEQDLPRLAATRIERRLLAPASLYPDDEYGAFFEALVKSAGNEEYSGALKEESFWIKRSTDIAADTDIAENLFLQEPYDFFVLVSVDRVVMQNRIRDIMEKIETTVSPTRDQAAAINRIKQNFFEGF